jgi:Uncharacterized protein conserved in bacteria
MIMPDKIIRLTEDVLTGDQFIVSVEVSPTNVIMVTLDSEKGISIDDCIKISRHIENNLDREEEDFELQVSSSGLGQPLKVFRQYVKNTGKEVEVIHKNGEKKKGILKNVYETSFELEYEEKEKVEGQKRKQVVIHSRKFTFDEIKTVKNIIKF